MKIIGLDIGTTSISAAVWNMTEMTVERSYTIPNKSFLDTGRVWEKAQDPEWIIDQVRRLLDEILDETKEAAAIGLTGQMHGILYLDKDGKSVSPLYTWQDERGNQAVGSGQSLCEELTERHGVPFYTGYGLVTHIYNLRKGILPAEAVSLCTIMDYLGVNLTGRKRPLMHSSNAASLGFYDIEAAFFRRDLLGEEGVDCGILPQVTSEIEVLGYYRGIPVTTAIGDNQASFIGSVRHGKEEILANIGTGGQISMYADHVIRGEDIETRPLTGDGYIIAGSSLCGGRAYAVLADFFCQCAVTMGIKEPKPYEWMNQLLASYQPDQELVIETCFSGTRDHPLKRGMISNITTGNLTPAALTYGVVKGIAKELYQRYQTMCEGRDRGHIRIIGSGNGMRRNPYLQKVTQELFGMELVLSDNTEEAACGSAIAAGTAVSELTWKEVIGVE